MTDDEGTRQRTERLDWRESKLLEVMSDLLCRKLGERLCGLPISWDEQWHRLQSLCPKFKRHRLKSVPRIWRDRKADANIISIFNC